MCLATTIAKHISMQHTMALYPYWTTVMLDSTGAESRSSPSCNLKVQGEIYLVQ